MNSLGQVRSAQVIVIDGSLFDRSGKLGQA